MKRSTKTTPEQPPLEIAVLLALTRAMTSSTLRPGIDKWLLMEHGMPEEEAVRLAEAVRKTILERWKVDHAVRTAITISRLDVKTQEVVHPG